MILNVESTFKMITLYNEWDNVEYDQLFDIYENLKSKLQNNKEVKVNIPTTV